MTDDQIKHMVEQFLRWRLPDNFNPDGGISFKADYNEGTAYPRKYEPVGTNLFDYTQAEAMVRHMIEGMPVTPPIEAAQPQEAVAWRVDDLTSAGKACGEFRFYADYKSVENHVQKCGVSPTKITPLYATPPQAAESGLLEAATALCDKLDEALPHINSAIFIAANHHCEYTGPAIDKELANLKTLLAKAGKQGEGDREGHAADAVRDACLVILAKVVSFDDSRKIGYSDFSVEPCSSLNHLPVLKRLHCGQRYTGSPCFQTFSLGSR